MPLTLTVFCVSKIQIDFTFLILALCLSLSLSLCLIGVVLDKGPLNGWCYVIAAGATLSC